MPFATQLIGASPYVATPNWHERCLSCPGSEKDAPILDTQERVSNRRISQGKDLNSKSKHGARTPRLPALLAAGVLAAGLCLAAEATTVPVNVSASIGGVPTGNSYESFDGVVPGHAGGMTTSGITVQFSADGQAVQGAWSGRYAPPFLSDSNGMLFGNPGNGANTTTYLTTGI
ncbi:MAG: hypothetical protein ABI300_03710, partial [Rhodanobacter sp.]